MNKECCGIAMDLEDGVLSCIICERSEPWVPEVTIRGANLSCGEFRCEIIGDQIELLVCAGQWPEIFEETLGLNDLAQLRSLLATADAEIRRRREERKNRVIELRDQHGITARELARFGALLDVYGRVVLDERFDRAAEIAMLEREA